MSRSNGSRGRGTRKEQHVFDYEGHRVTRNGISANHLLNFSLPEREKSHGHVKKKKNGRQHRTQMEYLHANYRFVIAPLPKDIALSCWDLETLTEWNSVEQVRLWHDEASPTTCPICLDTFRAPKITRCGHIFCWPCILRYLSLTDKYWRRCPMCFDAVQKSQLRSVCLEQVAVPPRLNTNVTFQFLQRSKSSLFPYIPGRTSESTRKRRRRVVPRVDDVEATFARVVESTHDYLTTLAMEEMRELESLEVESRSCGDVESLPFIEEAMKNTSQRLAAHETAAQSSSRLEEEEEEIEAEDQVVGTGDKYSFYQLENGSYVVLHPLNLKCLLKEFGSTDTDMGGCLYQNLPRTIEGRVLDVEHVIMNDENDKRYRFLTHFPRFCDFYICEIDVVPFLSKETMDSFRMELKKRDKQRRSKQQPIEKKEKPTVQSPVLDAQFQTFSLQQEGGYWPVPAQAELTMSESLDENTSEMETQVMPSYLEEASYARITQESGYYPPLTSGTASTTSVSGEMWGMHVNPLIYTTTSSLETSTVPKGKKKGKGIPLFSTNQQRSYR